MLQVLLSKGVVNVLVFRVECIEVIELCFGRKGQFVGDYYIIMIIPTKHGCENVISWHVNMYSVFFDEVLSEVFLFEEISILLQGLSFLDHCLKF